MINDRIETPRLILIATSAELLKLELTCPNKLGERLNVIVPGNWPPEFMKSANPIFFIQLQNYPSYYRWCTWYWVLKNGWQASGLMIGCGGFMGPPDKHGTVEIGYSILPQFEGKGFATEGTGALVKWGFAHERVKLIAAETYPHLVKSIRILEKLGFTCTGRGEKPSTIRYEISRRSYSAEPSER
jgi:RimJ/RimL family protein N-acetyltransferase